MAPTKQKAVRINELKDDLQQTLQIEEVDVPQPSHGEALVRVALRPVNPTDVIQSQGLYGGEPPFTPGSEGVGYIESFGPGASGRLSVGQRVISTTWGLQSWQEYVALKEEDLVAVPEDVNDEIASQIFIGTATVIGLLETAAVPKGEWLLQTAAASAVGRQVVQLAKSQGIKTINTVRRAEQVQELKDLGADEVIDTSSEDFQERVKEITGGKGAYAAIDPVAGRTTNEVVKALRPGGKDVIYGVLEDSVIHVDVTVLFGRSIDSFVIYAWLPAQGAEGARKRLEQGFRLFQDGVLTAAPGKRYTFSDVKAAVAESLKSRTANSPKVFLTSE